MKHKRTSINHNIIQIRDGTGFVLKIVIYSQVAVGRRRNLISEMVVDLVPVQLPSNKMNFSLLGVWVVTVFMGRWTGQKMSNH